MDRYAGSRTEISMTDTRTPAILRRALSGDRIDISEWTSKKRLLVAAGLTATVQVVSTWLLLTPTLVDALAVPLGVLLGVPGAVGFGLGRAIVAVLAVDTTVATVVEIGLSVLFAVLAHLLWAGNRLPGPEATIPDRVSAAWGVLLVAGVAFLLTVGTRALVSAFVGAAPFGVLVAVDLSERAVPAVVLGGGLLLCAAAVGFDDPTATPTGRRSPRSVLALGALVVGWFAVGIALSLGRQEFVTAGVLDRQLLAASLPDVAHEAAFAVLGPFYQVVHAGMFLTVVAGAWLLLSRRG
jgi:hypothetical protein